MTSFNGPVTISSSNTTVPALRISGLGPLLLLSGLDGEQRVLVDNDGNMELVGDIILDGSFVSTHGQAVEVDFGDPVEDATAMITVDAPWVTETSALAIRPLAIAGTDHDPEDTIVEDIAFYIANVVPGVSFDVYASAPHDSWGRYSAYVTG